MSRLAMSLTPYRPIATAGGGGYTAQAVHFNGATYLDRAALSCTNSFDVSLSFWFKTTDMSGTFLGSDPTAEANNILYLPLNGKVGFALGENPFTNAMEPTTATTWNNGQWHSCIFSANTNHLPGSRVWKYYIDDVDASGASENSGGTVNNAAFMAAFNGLLTRFGSDGGDHYTGDVFDFQLYLGASLLAAGDIPVAKRRLFINASGKPVAPATAIAELGTPVLLFSGGASSFATNQGSGGAFTVAAGALTNASTSPSD